MIFVSALFMILPCLVRLTLGLKPSPQSFIVGGSVAQESELPFMARVLVRNMGSCGGFILSNRWIATAAHCVVDQGSSLLASPNMFQIIVGTNSNTTAISNAKKVTQVVVAPGYSVVRQKDDLALLKLSQELKFNERIQPIPIGTSKITAKESFTAAGWGITENGSASAQLLKVDLHTAPVSKCRRIVPGFRDNNGPQICIDAEVGKDTCPGDSGGPLFRSEPDGFSVHGITSYSAYPQGSSTICGAEDTIVGVYTHVKYYLSFISSTTGLSEEELIGPYDTAPRGNADSSSGAALFDKSYPMILSMFVILLIF